MNAEDQNDRGLSGEEQETPVCLKCFRPISPLAHSCPHCGEAAGQYTPNLPFESIRWQAQTWGRAWRQIWSPGLSIWSRWFRLVMIVLNAPFLLIGVFWQIRPKRRQPRAGS